MLLQSRLFLFLVLMLPALAMLAPLALGAPWRVPIRPTGEAAAILLVLALAISPLKALFATTAWTRWLVRQRRAIGLAAAAYSAIHMVVLTLSVGSFADILAGMAWASMWTGWAAFAALLVMAAISNDRALRAMGRSWKAVQRLAYPAAVLTLGHWLLLTREWTNALIWLAPLALLQLARLAKSLRARNSNERTKR
ncbi:ferric reductase-like transmembrane domain-containing protein [Mesorhizobium sp. YIM 152430]|uniref:ferric reductase-like transmembrane domain-containing protein n=1 Tax=Mesorhizobium sp. YIM 152430 TaxID=3031761 RepID=UPI0023D9CD12|nr:ferric reductase-like transmembrane domain-containing protein [Mesorhizobium sp. YIM 152430]MDF1598167.1 ferric reductase-like transmembrane domain-containing protein [Mesorhizobium sp. YIM 152430]